MHFRSFYLAAALLMALVASPAVAQESTATVTIFHAVPADDGFPADVYLNGELIIDGFVFETASESFTVPAGAAEVEVFAEGADPRTDTPAVTDSVTFDAGWDYSIVAQLVEDAPVLSVFLNDTSQVDAGQARLTVRQTSGIGEIDVALDGQSLFDGLRPAMDATTHLPAGPHDVAFLATGETLAERSVNLAEGGLVVLYAVGSDDSFNLLIQRVVAQQTAPGGVPSGTGGYKTGGDWSPVLFLAAGIATLARVRHSYQR